METNENNTQNQTQTETTPVANASNTQSAPGKPVEQKTLMAILAYLGVLILIPYLVANDDPFVKFHIKQGLVLVIIELVAWFAGSMIWPLHFILFFVQLAMVVLSIMGIINVLQNREKELPLTGTFARNLNI